MSNEDLTELLKFDLEIDNKKKSIELPENIVNEINNSKADKVTVSVLISSKNRIENSELDKDLFEKIKKIQSLPDNVVYNFLNSKGALFRSTINTRLADA